MPIGNFAVLRVWAFAWSVYALRPYTRACVACIISKSLCSTSMPFSPHSHAYGTLSMHKVFLDIIGHLRIHHNACMSSAAAFIAYL